MTSDEEHLNLLSIFHYVVGGITACMACIPFIHVGIGIALATGVLEGGKDPPKMFGWFFIIFGSAGILLGWTLALAIMIASRKLKQRASWTYCVVIAGIECMMMPFGTALGVFTLIVLMRDSVKKLFETQSSSGFV